MMDAFEVYLSGGEVFLIPKDEHENYGERVGPFASKEELMDNIKTMVDDILPEGE